MEQAVNHSLPQIRLMLTAAEKNKAEMDIRAMHNMLPFHADKGGDIFKDRSELLNRILNAED